MNEINLGKYKPKEQKKKKKKKENAIYNMEQLYKARNNVIKFFGDCSSLTSDARHKAILVKSLKILTPKRILEILLKTPPKVKENLPINIFFP